jgi:hypothetical protein
MAGINPKHIKVALDYCRMNLEWPPSIAEFRKICEQAAGVLPWETAFDLAVRSGDLTDPNVRATYDRIGSWAMTHDKEVDLRRKFKTTYEDILAQGRVIANEAKQLEGGSAPIRLPVPELVKEVKKDRRQELIEMSEEEAGKLGSGEWYERICYLREIEGMHHILKVNKKTPHKASNFAAVKSSLFSSAKGY